MTPEQIARELPFVLDKQDAEGLRQLHAGGLNINACTHTGLSLLQDATLNGKLVTARTLVELGADVNAQGGTSQMTALHFAVHKKQKELVEILLAKGADPNRRDSTGETPLHLAAFGGMPEIARVLVDAGADLTAQDNRKMTPWDVAQTAADERFEFANQDYWATATLLAEAERIQDGRKQAAENLATLKTHPYKNFRLKPGR